MTIGIGRKFGKRIILVSDTMISDESTGKPDAVPGRIKNIILNPYVSISYSGYANQSIDAVRDAKKKLDATGEPSAALESLIKSSKPSLCGPNKNDSGLDFLLAFHENGNPFLYKITSGGVSSNLDGFFIGDSHIANSIINNTNSNNEKPSGHDMEILSRMGIFPDEQVFLDAFQRLFIKSGTQINENVGGFPIALIASPYGHFYQNFGTSHGWSCGDIQIGSTEHHNNWSTGAVSWSFNIVTSKFRGVSVVGAALPQIGLGFVYRPLQFDDPEQIRIDDKFVDRNDFWKFLLRKMQERIDYLAKLGGGIEELDI